MKKYITKFKHWLIKKLGGYTESEYIKQPQQIYKQLFIEPITKKPIKLTAKMVVPGERKLDNEEILKQELVRLITAELYKLLDTHFCIYERYMPVNMEYEYSLSVDVLPHC